MQIADEHEIKDEFTHVHYGKFTRYRAGTVQKFTDEIRVALKRGTVKSRSIESKNYVIWTSTADAIPRKISLSTWGEIHALFRLSESDLDNNILHQYLVKVSSNKY